jgi:hypothetical protein
VQVICLRVLGRSRCEGECLLDVAALPAHLREGRVERRQGVAFAHLLEARAADPQFRLGCFELSGQ